MATPSSCYAEQPDENVYIFQVNDLLLRVYRLALCNADHTIMSTLFSMAYITTFHFVWCFILDCWRFCFQNKAFILGYHLSVVP